jgi:hypothetical protein
MLMMARWVEQRGFTLRLCPTGSGSEAERFVRASVVARRGFLSGGFNVREARAEPKGGEDQPLVLGGGRLLSWRWLTEGEADRMLAARLRVLEAMGYDLVDAQLALRGPWDWLRDLFHRGLSGDTARREPAEPRAHQALCDALSRLGLHTSELVEGIADVLGLHPVRFENPDPETVARVDPGQLEVLLPLLIEHTDPALRSIGERWLANPTTVFELRSDIVLSWLERDGEASRMLAPRLAREGLALVGPDGLARLAVTSKSQRVRENARVWLRRLGASIG